MSDFNAPSLSSLYTTFLSELKDRDVSAITLCVSDPSNIPTGAMKWNRANDLFQEYSGVAWVDQVLSIAGGGTGAITAAASRTSLGLGSMAVQNSNAIAVTGGSIGAAVSINAASIVAGTVASARLGSGGGGTGALFLSDAGTFLPGVPVGSIVMWPTGSAPTNWLALDGSAVSRTTYAGLFALFGTLYGVGDGSTTFNLPLTAFRYILGGGYNPAIGTAGVSNNSDNYLHQHSIASHTHTIPGVYPHSHTTSGFTVNITDPGHAHQYNTFASGGVGSDYPAGATAGVYDLFPTTSVATGITADGSVTVDSAGATTATGGTALATDNANYFPPYMVFLFIIKAL